MVLGRPNLGRILIETGVVSTQQLEAALEYQSKSGCRLGEALIALGICSDADIAQALANQLEIPYVDLHEAPPTPGSLLLVPREIALEYGVIPVRMEGDRLVVAALDPFDIRLDGALRQATDYPVILAIAPESQVREVLQQYYSENVLAETRTPQKDEAEELLAEDEDRISVERLTEAGEQISVVRVVNALIADCARRGASDLHIEPEATRIRIRYRIDGRLRPVVTLQRDLLPSMAARIKIMCGMDISETRKPQDGSCRVRVDGREIELRASTLRGVHGEIAVLRILTQNAGLHRLDALGLEPDTLSDLRGMLGARQGMVLIAGPTGSGKTTTLYAALNHLNRDDINVMTVEDPVEMKLSGINQIQVHDKAGRSFADTLRSMLRQDPDVIMVGEIRDGETADIACRSALTGHLVLSTIHTQHALGTVTRLFDMGIAPWMVTACLNGVVAQRLVQRTCEKCADDYLPPDGLLEALAGQFGDLSSARFRKGKGCTSCHRTGVRGRVGVYEVVPFDATIRHAMVQSSQPDSPEMMEYIAKQGYRSMEEDAFRKACRGVIAPEEVVNLGFQVARNYELVREEPAEPAETIRPRGLANGPPPASPDSARVAPRL